VKGQDSLAFALVVCKAVIGFNVLTASDDNRHISLYSIKCLELIVVGMLLKKRGVLNNTGHMTMRLLSENHTSWS